MLRQLRDCGRERHQEHQSVFLVRALDGIAKPVVESSFQANFRIATFRMNCSLDIRPSLDNVWLFFDLLLARQRWQFNRPQQLRQLMERPPAKLRSRLCKAPLPQGPPQQEPISGPASFGFLREVVDKGNVAYGNEPWEGVTDRASRCATCIPSQHLQADCPYKKLPKSPVGGEGDSREDGGSGAKGEKGGGKGKGKSKKTKNDTGQKSANKDSSQAKKDDGVNGASTAATEEDNKGKVDSSSVSSAGGGSGEKKIEGGRNGTADLLQEAPKLPKSLHMPHVKVIKLQEIGDPLKSPSNLMLLDSGAGDALRRATAWGE